MSGMPSIERLRETLICDPVEGKLYWKARGSPSWDPRFAGKEAGSLRTDGYTYVKVDEFRMLRHRIIWAMYHGTIKVPTTIDHIDRDRGNDTIMNLRAATETLNARNRGLPANNTSGVKGVNWYPKYGKWIARVGTGKGRSFLGYFDTLEEAVAARKQGEIDHGW